MTFTDNIITNILLIISEVCSLLLFLLIVSIIIIINRFCDIICVKHIVRTQFDRVVAGY